MRPWDLDTDGPYPVQSERAGVEWTAHLYLTDKDGGWYATEGDDGRVYRHMLVAPSPEKAAREADHAAKVAAELANQPKSEAEQIDELRGRLDAAGL